MEFLTYLIVIIIGYLLGCIQSAYIIGRMSKIDIREHGSKSAGASNAFMTLGWKKGVIVGLIDILKAAIPVFIVTKLFPGNTILALVCGIAVVLGHVFPVFLGFKGGKGTASIVGITLGLNIVMFVIAGLIIIIITIITDYIALGTVAMLVSILAMFAIRNFGLISIILFMSVMALSFYKHWINFKRIKNGTESKLRSVISKN